MKLISVYFLSVWLRLIFISLHEHPVHGLVNMTEKFKQLCYFPAVLRTHTHTHTNTQLPIKSLQLH